MIGVFWNCDREQISTYCSKWKHITSAPSWRSWNECICHIGSHIWSLGAMLICTGKYTILDNITNKNVIRITLSLSLQESNICHVTSVLCVEQADDPASFNYLSMTLISSCSLEMSYYFWIAILSGWDHFRHLDLTFITMMTLKVSVLISTKCVHPIYALRDWWNNHQVVTQTHWSTVKWSWARTPSMIWPL